MINSNEFQNWLIAQGYYRVKGVWHNLGSTVHKRTLEKKLKEFEKRKVNIIKKPRTPTDMMDQLTIYCHRMRKQGKTLYNIAKDVGKDHSTVVYHLQRYKDLMRVDKAFQLAEEEFNQRDFIIKYKSVHYESN